MANKRMFSKETNETNKKFLSRREVYKRDGLKATITQALRNKFRFTPCPLCKTIMTQEFIRSKPTLDHIIPICQGGTHTEDNWRIICLACNVSRNFKNKKNVTKENVR